MGRVLVAVGVLCAAVGCAGDPESAPRSARASCEQYREHLIEVRLEGVTADREAHRGSIRQSLGDGFVARCEAETSTAELECGLAAKSIDELRACASRH